jgi:hypothetical protein
LAGVLHRAGRRGRRSLAGLDGRLPSCPQLAVVVPPPSGPGPGEVGKGARPAPGTPSSLTSTSRPAAAKLAILLSASASAMTRIRPSAAGAPVAEGLRGGVPGARAGRSGRLAAGLEDVQKLVAGCVALGNVALGSVALGNGGIAVARCGMVLGRAGRFPAEPERVWRKRRASDRRANPCRMRKPASTVTVG